MDNVAKLQALELSEAGHEVTVFTFNSSKTTGMFKIVELTWPQKPLFNYIYRIVYPLDLLKNYNYSRKLKNYDIIIAHFYPMTFLAYFARKMHHRIKYIYYNHGIGNNNFNPLLENLFIKYINLLTNLSISNAECIVSISHFVSVSSHFNRCIKKEIIYNKVDLSKFEYIPSDISHSILNIGNENTKNPVFLYIGVLNYFKGIPLLIESFKKVLETYPNAKLILVGKLAYHFDLYKLLDENLLHNVLYLGRVSNKELGYLYEICDVYVSASTWESFNLPVVEAQLLGNPVVVYDIGAHKEVINNNETGVLVEPFDISKFSDSMIKTYIKKEEMGQNAKKWALKFFSKQKDTSLTDLISSLFN